MQIICSTLLSVLFTQTSMSVHPLHAWMVGHVWMKWTSSPVSVPEAGLETPVRALCQHVGTTLDTLAIVALLKSNISSQMTGKKPGLCSRFLFFPHERSKIPPPTMRILDLLQLNVSVCVCITAENKICPTTFICLPFSLSSSFSLCHHDKHICCHLLSHCGRLRPPCCHQRPKRPSITLHHNTGDHPLHLWAWIHHLRQRQQRLHRYK